MKSMDHLRTYSLLLALLSDVWHNLVTLMRTLTYNVYSSLNVDMLPVEKIIKERPDFRIERHWAETKDGMTLMLYRIHKKDFDAAKVVLLQHGLVENSSTFMTCGNESITHRLVDQGYDVWLASNRASFYGQMTKTESGRVKPNKRIFEPSFWEYSMDELIHLDFPACFDYVLNETKVDKINFVGQSQGCVQVMCSMCEMPQIRQGLKNIVLISPALLLQKYPSNIVIRSMMLIPDSLLGTREFLMFFIVLQQMLPTFLVGFLGYVAARLLGFLQCSPWSYSANKRWSTLFSGILFGCTSVKNIKHWVEVLRRGGAISKYGKTDLYQLDKLIDSWSDKCPNVMCILGDKDYVAD
ncbi:hypothetical protein AKO1_014019, partial [Acrasis kona]